MAKSTYNKTPENTLVIPKPIITNIYQGSQQARTDVIPPTGVYNTLIGMQVVYPDGYEEFQEKVEAGLIRMQLVHWDTKTKSRKSAPDGAGGISSQALKRNNTPRFIINQNADLDYGDYFFGSKVYDINGIQMPNVLSAVYLPINLKSRQPIDFQLDCPYFYGKDADTVGRIVDYFPFTYIDAIKKDSVITIRGEGYKTNFIGREKPVVLKLSKYFSFVFMYKNDLGKWEMGDYSQQFRLSIDTINYDDGMGTTEKYYYRFVVRLV